MAAELYLHSQMSVRTICLQRGFGCGKPVRLLEIQRFGERRPEKRPERKIAGSGSVRLKVYIPSGGGFADGDAGGAFG